ncbi:MAG: hypothetical protein ACFFCD_07980 [Promethearchaeota archaeon]
MAATLLIIGGLLAYLGTRLDHSVEVERPGKAIRILLVVLWGLAFSTFVIAVDIYIWTLYQQVGKLTLPVNPISPITTVSGLVTFITIAFLARHHGLKIAVGSAIVGTLAAPMIFELPFDLIVMGRTYPPTPAVQFTLLFFLPLFLVEIISFMLLTLSPLTKMSRYTLFSLAAMFFVFAVWALFGFSYPSSAIPIALNVVSKILSFVAAITLFLPQKELPKRRS